MLVKAGCQLTARGSGRDATLSSGHHADHGAVSRLLCGRDDVRPLKCGAEPSATTPPRSSTEDYYCWKGFHALSAIVVPNYNALCDRARCTTGCLSED
ncbi:hypothetical protein PRNP1_006729 [Phytophthora ramorum]